MPVKLGEVIHFDIATHSPISSGRLTNADETPRFWVFEEDTDTPIISFTSMTARGGNWIGLYRGNFTASTANGFEAGKWYNVIVSGRVDNIYSAEPRMTFMMENNALDDVAGTSGIIRQNLDKTAYSVGTGGITSTSFAQDAIDRNALSLDATQDIGSGVWNFTDGRTTGLSGVPTVNLASGVVQADVVRLNNIAASGHNGVFDAHIADSPMGGAALTLIMKQLKITGNNTGGDGSLSITNTGSGPGFKSTGGSNFAGAHFIGGSDSHGVLAVGVGLGDGLRAQGGADGGDGAAFIGTHTGDGLTAQAGISGVDIRGRITLASGEYAYYADIRFDKDATNDDITATWFRNTVIMGSGQVGSPQVNVIKVSDGTDLVATTNMDFISINTGTVKYSSASNRTTAGEPYIVKCTASIDAATRTWQKLISRDT
jgi:hypothetical protein